MGLPDELGWQLADAVEQLCEQREQLQRLSRVDPTESEMKKLKICWIYSSDLMFPVAKKLHKFSTHPHPNQPFIIWELSIYLSLLNFKM